MLTNQTEKTLTIWSWLLHVACLGITVLGFVALHLFILRPIDRHHRDVVRQAVMMELILDREVEVTTEHRRLTESLIEADQKIERLLDQIPSVPREADFLGQVTTLARDVGLEIVDYRPGGIVEHEEYQEMSVAMTSVGSYAGICHFLYRIHQIPRLSRAMQLEISPEREGDTYSMQMILNIYFAPHSKLAVASGGQSNG